ncbi:MAG: T9SS type A sorting domain-containing protein [Crocinitomix sp.]|nr:T9SS type A sorting domain-containing protein [Crocinitomix sp.]
MKNSLLIICFALFANLSWSQCDGFEMTVIFQNPTCHYFTDGSITITASGGTAPLVFAVQDSLGNELFPGPSGTGNCLASGCYSVMVTDAIGCVLTDTVCLINPDPITVDLIITDPTYPGACDGIVIADTVYGYQGAYESIGYYWTIPGATITSEVTDVCAGEYNVTINDEIGCSGVFDFALGSLAEIPMNAIPDIEVFTNRKKGELIVQDNYLNDLNIKLLNLAGHVVFDAEINSQNAVYSPDLKPGVYIYTVASNQAIVKTGKLVF